MAFLTRRASGGAIRVSSSTRPLFVSSLSVAFTRPFVATMEISLRLKDSTFWDCHPVLTSTRSGNTATMVLLRAVACVMGASKLPSVPFWVGSSFQHTEVRPEGAGAKKHRPGSRAPAGARNLSLSGALRGAPHRLRRPPVPVAVLVIRGDEVGVTEDPVLVDIQAVELLVGLDPDADGGLEGREDRERGEEDEPAAGDDAEGLDAELVKAAAVEEAGLADRGQGRGREEAAGERAPDAAHAVRGDGAERVVHPDPVDEHERRVHDYARYKADDYGGPGCYEGAGGGDGDECRDGAVAAHADVDVLAVHVAHGHGAEDAGGSREGGGERDVGDLGACRHRGAGVEAVPADPKDQDAENRQRHVVAGDVDRTALVVVLAEPGAEEQGTGERGHGAREVDDRRAGEVLHAELGEPAAAPDPVPDQRGEQARENHGEDHVDGELRPLEHGAPHDGEGDGAEGYLEEELGRERDLRPGEPCVDLVYLPGGNREEPALRPEDGVAGAERDGEAYGPEQEGRDREVDQYLCDHATDVLHAGEPDLQHREPGLHKQHQHRRDDHPHRVHRQRQVGRRGRVLR